MTPITLITHSDFKALLPRLLYDGNTVSSEPDAHVEPLTEEEKAAIKKYLEASPDARLDLDRLKKMMTEVQAVRNALPDDLLSEARQDLHAALHRDKQKPENAKPSRRVDWRPDRLLKSLGESVAVAVTATASPTGMSRLVAVLGGAAIFVLGLLVGFAGFSYQRFAASDQATTALVSSDSSLSKALGATGAKGSPTVFNRGEVQITNVRIGQPDSASGMIEFSFDAVTPVYMKGGVSDEEVKRLLTYALSRESNPGVRLQTLNTLRAYQPQLAAAEQGAVKMALIAALRSDPNPGVRKEALQILQTYPVDDSVKTALLTVLSTDENAGLRIAAVNFLASVTTRNPPDAAETPGASIIADAFKTGGSPSPRIRITIDQETVRVLEERVKLDNNQYVRLRADAILRER